MQVVVAVVSLIVFWHRCHLAINWPEILTVTVRSNVFQIVGFVFHSSESCEPGIEETEVMLVKVKTSISRREADDCDNI